MSVTMFLKNTCSIIGIVPPVRFVGICIAEKRNAERHMRSAPFLRVELSLRLVIILNPARHGEADNPFC